MDSPTKNRFTRTFTKVLHLRKTHEKQKPITVFFNQEDEKLHDRATMAAFIAKVFATLSSVKSAYAQLQYAQSPYDPKGIQSADYIMITELKKLSELKQSYIKNHIDDSSPETTILVAEIQEQKNLSKTYEITRKRLASQIRLKDSEIMFLKEKLEEINNENRRLNSISDTNLDFITALKQTTKSIRSLVKFMMTEMEYANWDLNAAANSIQPDVDYWDSTHICYAFESFVCREMFDGFDRRNFTISGDDSRLRFMELKYMKAREYVTWKPKSTFAKFCMFKYLKLVHPKMELSLFGNLNQRNLVVAGKLPETNFFELFAEAARRVWLLHCVGFSLDPAGASMFLAGKGCRFSEVFMEIVNEEAFLSPDSRREVAFTVVPGFKVGKSVVQCRVYLC